MALVLVSATDYPIISTESTLLPAPIINDISGELSRFSKGVFEMGTKLANERGEDLYQFLDTRITDIINERMDELAEQSEDNVLINLASNEYFKSIKKRALNAQIITPRFEDEKNGEHKVISFYAKKARGLMVNYAAENKVTNADALKKFDLAGYYYVAEASDDNTWTLRRDEADQSD